MWREFDREKTCRRVAAGRVVLAWFAVFLFVLSS